MLHFLRKKKTNNAPQLWITQPELYPDVISSFRKMKNIVIQHNNKKKVIFLLTGPERKIGVSTIAFNLALICGWDIPEKRILLIDANVSNPILHQSFFIKQMPGLSDFLYGNNSFSEIVYKTSFSNFDLIPCGSSCLHMSSPFTRLSFQELIETIKRQYNIIIIDSEPIICSGYTQSMIPYIDEIILIAEVGVTKLENINNVYSKLKSCDANFLGIFLNRKKHIIPNFLYKLL